MKLYKSNQIFSIQSFYKLLKEQNEKYNEISLIWRFNEVFHLDKT